MIIDLPRTVGGATSLTCLAPTANAQFAISSDSYDCGGSSESTGWFPGDNEQLFIRFEVTTAFVTANNATCNFFWCMSDNSNPSLSALTLPMAFSGGSLRLAAGTSFGMRAADLTVGAALFMPLTGFDPIIYGELANFQTHRYLSIGILCQNYVVPATFTAGAVKAHVTKVAERDRLQRYVFPHFKVV